MILLGGIGGVLLLYHLRGILAPFLLAWILAYVLLPVVDGLEKRGVARVGAILLVYLVLLGLVGAGMVFLLPGLAQETDRLGELIPQYTRMGQDFFREAQEDVDRFGLPLAIRAAILETISGWEEALLDWASQAVDRTIEMASLLLRLALAPVLAFYFLRDWRYLGQRFWDQIPPAYRDKARQLGRDLDGVLAGFIRGQLLVAGIVGVSVGVTAQLLGLKFSFFLGFIAGLAEIIPYFGPFLGALPALLVAALSSVRSLLLMLLAIILIQQVESAVLSPVIVGQRVGLHPVVVVFALLLGGMMVGVTGLLLAVPAAGILKVVGGFALSEARRGGVAGERGGSSGG